MIQLQFWEISKTSAAAERRASAMKPGPEIPHSHQKHC
jgi:hypothetical protein